MAGSGLAIEIWDMIREYVPQKKRQALALAIYDMFCDEDADEWYGTSQLEIDADINQSDEDWDGFEDPLEEEE